MSEQGTQVRYSTSFTVSFPDFPSFDLNPRLVNLKQARGLQDLLTIVYPVYSQQYMDALHTGVAVKLSWSNEKGGGDWYGYVYSVHPDVNQSLDRPLIVKCLGAALGLKEGGTKIWTNKYASDIVTEIAKQFKLSPKVTPSKIFFSQQTLYQHTYWEKIQELAHDSGYVAQLIGTELHFHPLDRMIDQSMGSSPILEYKELVGEPKSAIEGATLDNFVLSAGDFSANKQGNKRVKTIAFVDPLTGNLSTSSSDSSKTGRALRGNSKAPLFSENLHSTMVANKPMAEAMAFGAAQLDRYTHSGSGLAQGDLRISPYKTVQIKGVGPQVDGPWVITEVTHYIDHVGAAKSDFKCMADGSAVARMDAFRTENNTQIALRNLEYEITNQVQSKPTDTRLVGSTIMVNETDGGFVTAPRRWAGY
jgi:phage protein D